MVSALEHWSYCPRQCALIHVEQTFDENLYTSVGGRCINRLMRLNQWLSVGYGSNVLCLFGIGDLVW